MARTADIEIYLEIQADEGAQARLAAALAACRAAAVMIGGKLAPAQAKTLVEMAQKAGAAAIIADDARLARTLRADGVHLTWSIELEDRYEEARDLLGTHVSVGVEAGNTRHDAMSLGEAGADYVAFGSAIGAEQRREMIAWWSEIFEVPCVALGVENAAEAGRLAAAGADFIGIPLPAGLSADRTADTVRSYLKAIRAAEGDEATERAP